jgi:hypothetical protein
LSWFQQRRKRLDAGVLCGYSSRLAQIHQFIAKEIRKVDNKVCYEIWIDTALLCMVVWISATQKRTHGKTFLEEWCRRHEESLKIAGIVGVDLTNETFIKARAATNRAQ